MKDYHIKIRIQNNRLVTLMEERNIATATELALKSGISASYVGYILNLKVSVMDWKGNVRVPIQRLADYLKVLPEDLFPKQHYDKSLKVNVITTKLNLDEIAQLTYSNITPLLLLEEKETSINILKGVKDRLTGREYEVVCLRFGLDGREETTLRQCGAILGVTQERIRQVEAKALRKLRHPLSLPKILNKEIE